MLLIILGIALIIVGSIVTHFAAEDALSVIGFGGTLIGIIVTLVAAIVILIAHVNVDYQVQMIQMDREALVMRAEAIECLSADSDIVRIEYNQVIQDITSWNKQAYMYKFWAESPWVNLMHNQKILDARQPIEYPTLQK